MEAMNLLQNNGMGQQQQQQQIHQQLPMSQPQLQHQRMLPCPSNQVHTQSNCFRLVIIIKYNVDPIARHLITGLFTSPVRGQSD